MWRAKKAEDRDSLEGRSWSDGRRMLEGGMEENGTHTHAALKRTRFNVRGA